MHPTCNSFNTCNNTNRSSSDVEDPCNNIHSNSTDVGVGDTDNAREDACVEATHQWLPSDHLAKPWDRE